MGSACCKDVGCSLMRGYMIFFLLLFSLLLCSFDTLVSVQTKVLQQKKHDIENFPFGCKSSSEASLMADGATERSIGGHRSFLAADGKSEKICASLHSNYHVANVYYKSDGIMELETIWLPSSLYDFDYLWRSKNFENFLGFFNLILAVMEGYDFTLFIDSNVPKNQNTDMIKPFKVTLHYTKASSEKCINKKDCVFCKILDKTAPGNIIATSEHAFAFLKHRPTVTADFLISPREHVANLKTDFCNLKKYAEVLLDMILLANKIADKRPYTLHINNGSNSSQVIYHLHAHIAGNWPSPKL